MIRLALYFHNHQPVGNFDEIFEFAYSHAYLPLLKAFLAHKRIKFGIHNSGPLCNYLLKRHPEYFELLKEALKSNQVEILASAYSEPILSLIPPDDVIDQIKYFKDYIFKLLGYEAKGFWLTERVWEPGLIPLLNEAGIDYTLLDDTHFRYAGLGDEELSSYFITEDCGRILKVFPISMKLRYLIPFHRIEESIDYLREESKIKEGILKTLGDDGEKFGVWPGTYDWVYSQNWLENFLNRLEKEEWIETVHLNEVIKEQPVGRIYLPTASYEEMGEWVLPLNAGRDYDELKRTVDRKYYHLIHGGYFKNFLARYPEANIMHKRMIYVSKNIAKDNLNARLALWRGQCSCAYWHGIFGGLYLPHLREAVYHSLIEADNFKIKKGIEVYDFDADGDVEIVSSNEDFFLVIKPKTGSLIELDDRLRKLNLLNYLGRRREKYHNRIYESSEEGEGVKSIHEIFKSKEKEIQKYLIYDRYERGFGIDHKLASPPSPEDFLYQENLGEIIKYSDYIINPETCRIEFHGDTLKKTVQLLPGRIIEISYKDNGELLSVEFSLGIFNPGLTIDGKYSLREVQSMEEIMEFSILADNLQPIRFTARENFSLRTYPIETISSSESGLEKIFQGFSLLLIFKRPPTIHIQF